MVEVPDALRSVFSASVTRGPDGRYFIEVPENEISTDAISPGISYRVGVIGTSPAAEDDSAAFEPTRGDGPPDPPEPPVTEGEVRTVTIESVGDQGDGIAKVDRGYVVIVPGASPGESPTIEIDEVRENVAFARVLDR